MWHPQVKCSRMVLSQPMQSDGPFSGQVHSDGPFSGQVQSDGLLTAYTDSIKITSARPD